MAVKKFVVEFEVENRACAVSRIDVWKALVEFFVSDIYISVSEVSPTKDAPDLGESSASDNESMPAPKRVI